MIDQVEVLPVKSFECDGAIRSPKSGAFFVDRRLAHQLQDMGLLRVVHHRSDPSLAAGEPPSVLPAAQVSQQTTSSASGAGAKRRKKQDA